MHLEDWTDWTSTFQLRAQASPLLWGSIQRCNPSFQSQVRMEVHILSTISTGS